MGAADAAPTAPHATPPVRGDKSGPARFWGNRGVKIALIVTAVFSLGVHLFFTPWQLLPHANVKMKDNDDELTVDVQLFGEVASVVAPPPPEEITKNLQKDPNGPGRDGGAPRDASVADAQTVATKDAGLALLSKDGGTDPGDAAASDASVAVLGDGGAGTPGVPRDPGETIGVPGLLSAGQVNVTLLVNVAVIRANAVGAQLGPLLNAVPQWASFMKGSSNAIDPIRDTDWILIYGPSLIHTDRDAVIVRYSVPDELVESTIEAIASEYEKGGALDVGVPGMKAWKGHADNGERAFLRAQPHVLVIVPPDKAAQFAKVMSKAAIAPKVRPTEAMRLTLKNPSKQIAIPSLKFDESVKEIRLWIVPRASDGGADVYAEGDCTDEASAQQSAADFTKLIANTNSFLVKSATGGVLSNLVVTTEGKQMKLHLDASQAQLDRVLKTVGGFLGAPSKN